MLGSNQPELIMSRAKEGSESVRALGAQGELREMCNPSRGKTEAVHNEHRSERGAPRRATHLPQSRTILPIT
jgi:hypothetical protein